MSLCIKHPRTPTSATGVEFGQERKNPVGNIVTIGFANARRRSDTEQLNRPPLMPKNPVKWGLPERIRGLELESVSVDFESHKVTYNISYLNPLLQVQPDCPDLIPPMYINYEYPYQTPEREFHTISFDCENDTNLFVAFLTHNQGGLTALTYPDKLTGQFLEDFFSTHILNDFEASIEVPENYICFNYIPLCEPDYKLRAVTIDADDIKYNIDVQGSPSSFIRPRTDDDIPLGGGASSPGAGAGAGLGGANSPIALPSYPASLQQDLRTVSKVARKSIVDKKLGEIAPIPKNDDESCDNQLPNNVCGSPDPVDINDVLQVLSLNMSFFSEKVLDILWIRIWLVAELILWFAWNILPLDDEWCIITQLVKRIFSIDPFEADGKCMPPALQKVLEQKCKLTLEPSSKCQKFSLTPRGIGTWLWRWLVCTFREIRDILAKIFLAIIDFLMWTLTVGAKEACKVVTGLTDGPDMNDKAKAEEYEKDLQEETDKAETILATAGTLINGKKDNSKEFTAPKPNENQRPA